MGVLYDYFRAADADAVAKLMERTRGSSPLHPGGAAVADGVDAKGVEPAVTLGKLVAMILDVEWSTDLVREDLVWPAGDGDDDGPWVVALGDRVRDALAGVDAARLTELAGRWAGIEEFSITSADDTEYLRAAATNLAGLARRARVAGDELYCWICL